MRVPICLGVTGLVAVQAAAQSVLFTFDNAPVHTSLPLDVMADGITAHLSATGQGYSIQWANTMGFTPAGFGGYCIYPNSIFPADLVVGFSTTLTDFSILYSPQELECDDSARMRVTAYLNGVVVGTNTTTAPVPGTWPTGTLSIHVGQGFNRVVVHYDAGPPTCTDWGPIFLADNMTVTPRSCYPDCNADGALTVADFGCFQTAFVLADPYADCNADGSLTVADFGCFQTAFVVACP